MSTFRERIETPVARRILTLLVLSEAVALLALGQRAMNVHYTPRVWFITWLAGLAAIVAIDFGLERRQCRPSKVTDQRSNRILSRRQWLLLGSTVPIAVHVWHESRFRPRAADHYDLLWTWIVLLGITFCITLWPVSLPPRPEIEDWMKKYGKEGIFLAIVTILAFIVRYSDLGLFDIRRRAWIFGGDEGQFAVAARRVLDGTIRNPFETTFDAHPTLWLFAQAGLMRVFGNDLRGVTMLSVIVGTVTVPIFYLLLRQQIGRAAAIVGATILATFHFHLWASRDAQNNVSSPFFLALVLLLLDSLLKRWSPRIAVGLGITLGLSTHAYVANRLLVAIVATVIAITVILGLRQYIVMWRVIAQSLVLVTLGFLYAVLPLAAYYIDHRDTFNARVKGVSIFSNRWIERTVELSGNSPAWVLWHHFEDAALLPFHTIPEGHYMVQPPLIGWLLVIPGAIGVAIVSVFALCRKYLSFAVAYWAVVVGVFLTDGGPQTNRYSMGALLLPIVATIGVITIERIVRWATRAPKPVIWLAIAVFLVASGFASLRVAFDRDSSAYWPPPNGEIANNEFAYQLRDEFPGYTTYLFGAPLRFYGGLKMFEFFAPNNRGFDVEDVVTEHTRPLVLTGPTVFFFPPERRDELAIVQNWFPGGIVQDHTLDDGQMLYTLYIIGSPPYRFLP